MNNNSCKKNLIWPNLSSYIPINVSELFGFNIGYTKYPTDTITTNVLSNMLIQMDFTVLTSTRLRKTGNPQDDQYIKHFIYFLAEIKKPPVGGIFIFS